MEIIIKKTKEEAEKYTAAVIASQIKKKSQSILGLATGRTVENVYSTLVNLNLDFSQVKTYNLDEYVGLAPDHDQSYRYYMNHHFFDNINIQKKNTRLPNGLAKDIDEECAFFEKEIQADGGIDLQLLGIGADGHLGFNEPTSSFASRTRIKTLTKETIEQNGELFGSEEDIPRHVLTMGIGTILDAGQLLLLATGNSKADIIAQAVEGPLTSMITASSIQLHQRCIVVLDEDSAAKLELQDYYRWVYENKPEWQKVL